MTRPGNLLALLIAGPHWFRGLERPDVVHMLETEDGRPRSVEVDGRAFLVSTAPCRAFLLGHVLPSPILPDTTLCSECRDIAGSAYGQAWTENIALRTAVNEAS